MKKKFKKWGINEKKELEKKYQKKEKDDKIKYLIKSINRNEKIKTIIEYQTNDKKELRRLKKETTNWPDTLLNYAIYNLYYTKAINLQLLDNFMSTQTVLSVLKIKVNTSSLSAK